jgi:hypothetical protein
MGVAKSRVPASGKARPQAPHSASKLPEVKGGGNDFHPWVEETHCGFARGQKVFRKADAKAALSEYERAQKAFHANRERLKAERLAREAAAKGEVAQKRKPRAAKSVADVNQS